MPVSPTPDRPVALQVDWSTPRMFGRDPVSRVELIATGSNGTVTAPLIYAGTGDDERAVNNSYSQPLATSAASLYDAFAGVDLTRAIADPGGLINAMPAQNGVEAGQVRVSFSNDQKYGRAVQSVILDSSSAAGQAVLGAAQSTQRDLFSFMQDFDAMRDGEAVSSF